MKVLFSALHFGFFRNFDSVVAALAERGHAVHLMADEPEGLSGQTIVEELAARYPGRVTWGWAPSYDSEPWFPVARKLRQAGDYLRFSGPPFSEFPKLRERAAERAPQVVRWLERFPGLNGQAGHTLVRRGLHALEAAMPRSTLMDRYLATERPDVVLLASLTNPRAPQLDHLRSARALGIPTAACVYSWDHLSSKALIRVAPDRVFVWNEVQKREAIDLHGMPADLIEVTGAQCYDQWFGRRPSRSRAAFFDDMGLPADRELFLYVCSALTPDPGEAAFVRGWIERIRRSDDSRVSRAAILIRPHPERQAEWKGVDLNGLGPVIVHGAPPVGGQAKSDYHDALAHSAAVVGLVTSAFLEAAIVGKPVLTVLWPELERHQTGMLHFRYLLEVEGGLLQVARGLDEHVRHLSEALRESATLATQRDRFLRAFVRPRGLDVPATPVFVDAVENLARLRPLPFAEPSGALVPVARRLVAWRDRAPIRWALMDGREAQEDRDRRRRVSHHREERRAKWRAHRRRKIVTRLEWEAKRVRGLLRPTAIDRHDS